MTIPEKKGPQAEITEQYARRDAGVDARRYSLFDAAALQAHQERLRAITSLWRAHGWQTLTGRRIVEVGCGSGGNLLDLLRLGAQANELSGIDLLPERVAMARRLLPSAVSLTEGDAIDAKIERSSQDAVLAFTVFSSMLDDAHQRRLASELWNWIKPGGGLLWYDFAFDNPMNPDVRGISITRLRALLPGARLSVRRVTLAPPLARSVANLHPTLLPLVAAAFPYLKTHRLVWATKP